MKAVRRVVVGLVVVLVVSATALGATRVGQTKKTSSTSSSNQTVLQKVGTATGSFFRGVADTVTLKKFRTSSSKK
jgi:hypothetical protein